MGETKTNPTSSGQRRVDRSSALHDLLQRYLEEEEAEFGDAPITAGTDADMVTPDPDAPPGEGQRNMSQEGLQRTTTGVIALMREEGNVSSAELLETLKETASAADRLLNELRTLHKVRTGVYPTITITRTKNKSTSR